MLIYLPPGAETGFKMFMSLFYCTVNQTLIHLIPFVGDAMLELVNIGNLVRINGHKPIRA